MYTYTVKMLEISTS